MVLTIQHQTVLGLDLLSELATGEFGEITLYCLNKLPRPLRPEIWHFRVARYGGNHSLAISGGWHPPLVAENDNTRRSLLSNVNDNCRVYKKTVPSSMFPPALFPHFSSYKQAAAGKHPERRYIGA